MQMGEYIRWCIDDGFSIGIFLDFFKFRRDILTCRSQQMLTAVGDYRRNNYNPNDSMIIFVLIF